MILAGKWRFQEKLAVEFVGLEAAPIRAVLANNGWRAVYRWALLWEM